MNSWQQLVQKYNRPLPRYTSYPTVPSWANNLSIEHWKWNVQQAFQLSNQSEGISLYIHLPFCESLCTYCACNTRITTNHAVEQPYIAALKKEFDLYLELWGESPLIAELHLGGGTPTFFSPENLHDLLSYILDRSHVNDHTQMSFEAHPANTSFEHLKTLRKLGFRRLSLGIQDFDETVQDLIHRFQSVPQVRQVMRDARMLGYDSINFDLIYGLPSQTINSLSKTLDEVLTLAPDRIAFYSYAHVPWIKPGQRKYEDADLPNEELKFALYQLGKRVFEQAGYFDIGMDHFAFPKDSLFQAANKQQLHRNFMGYTERHTKLMISLGVSSISDAWNAFAQNEKNLDAYYRAIEQNQFPIVRGHQHHQDDLVRRKLILDLMCKQEADFVPELIGNNAVALLDDLILDGIIKIEQNKILVNEFGKSFLRNVCAVYDRYLQIDSKRFSMAV